MSDTAVLSEEGVTFRSFIDGSKVHLGPESSMRVQNQIGADIIMAFDDCAPAALPAEDADERRVARTRGVVDHALRMEEAHERTLRWLDRCVQAHARKQDQALFGIVQGATNLDLRRRSVEGVGAHDRPGYAIGGVAVGEGTEAIKTVVEFTTPLLPDNRPRYLMGLRTGHRHGGGCRGGYVRLRPAHPQRSQCQRLHAPRPNSPKKCAICGRFAANRPLL